MCCPGNDFFYNVLIFSIISLSAGNVWYVIIVSVPLHQKEHIVW